ncbi:MAG: UDP-N-acetylmuramoyl-L-alanyl-D-glutamate-2, 6-diaminopimelate ligase [uncultured bacterium]|nr:MAG: UDP-N-acetylmuramoyl-L-alanyl-D-glutamate-2, 6-diaminopimelate ligase [uncultured bacterium]
MKKLFFIIKALVANIYYLFPSKDLKIIGVTGTDGKTTTSNIIYHILQNSDIKTGLVSTVNAKIGKNEYNTGFHVTNPGPFQLQSLLKKMVKNKLKYAVLEVTSHGLDQNRNFGINFDIGVLTNITHEHLDYHKTFENYVRAKAKLFQNSKICIINRNYFNFFKKYIKKTQKVILYDRYTLKGDLLKSVIQRFSEEYNVLNATAAVLVAIESGVNQKEILNGLKSFPGVEGRMQEIKNKLGIKIIVDFAHTPNALQSLLIALKNKKSKNSKIITVFGCAGERDVKKRPMMAKISTQLADASIFTAEDPRHEDVNKIIEQMKKGIKNRKAKVYEIPDRLEAIKHAINIAKIGDTVAICGKGHEKSMNFNGVEYPWSDKKAVESALAKSYKISAIILTAGKGSRMGGKIPKVLLTIGREPILNKIINKVKEIGIEDVVVVTGSGSTQVRNAIKKSEYEVKIVRQGYKTGTGGATMSGLKKVSKESDIVLVVYGDDSALYKKNTLKRFIKWYYSQNRPISAIVIEVKGVSPLGGLEVDLDGDIIGVLNPDELVFRGDKTTIVLCGLLCFNKHWLLKKIKLIPKNSKNGEYSLPYLLNVACREGVAAKPFILKNNSEWNSVNNPTDLKMARRKGRTKWKE